MSRELLTAILESCNEFNTFLTRDLQGQPLSPEVEGRRKQMIVSINGVIEKINSSHPSVRPRVVPPLPAPLPAGKLPPKPPAPCPDEVQEMYIDPQSETPEDYLAFTASEDPEQGPQETYEAMNTEVPTELYEDPVPGTLSPPNEVSKSPQPPLPPSSVPDGPSEVYEEPVSSPPPPPNIPTPTPPPSAENSGSGAVYARTQITTGPPSVATETATEWMYDTMKKDEKKKKPSQLENVSCKGNLEKLGGKNKKNWQVRYCVLAGPFMYFYEKESSKTYRNRIVLPVYTVSDAPDYTSSKKRHFAFKLTHTDKSGAKKDYFFRSSKKESCDTWIQAIQSLNDRATITPQNVVVTTPTRTAEGEGGVATGADVQQELYEPIDPIDPMTLSEEEDEDVVVGGGGEGDLEDYVDVVPQGVDDQEEYIDVPPPAIEEEEEQENYEDTSEFQSPPPVPPPLSSRSPAPTPASSRPPPAVPIPSRHRPDPPVDTDKIYTQTPNGINLQNVYVALWDFRASAGNELTVQRGDLVHILNPDPKEQWWAGEALDQNAAIKIGSYGFLPASYFMAAFEVV